MLVIACARGWMLSLFGLGKHALRDGRYNMVWEWMNAGSDRMWDRILLGDGLHHGIGTDKLTAASTGLKNT